MDTNTILVIDDDVDVADNVASILKLAHYNVLTANSGKEGVTIAQQYHPDLILCDIIMPDLDGYGVWHILSNDRATSDIPFIFETGKTDQGEFMNGMNLGVDGYITKPFHGTELLKVVEVRLRKAEALKKVQKSDPYNFTLLFDNQKGIKEVQKLLENKYTRSFKRKEFLYMQGQTPSDLFYIKKGIVKNYRANHDGKELITGLYSNGSFLGYVPILEETSYHESAVAMEPSEITIIPKNDLISLIYSSKDVARRFIKLLAKQVREAEARMITLAYDSVRQRVAWALLKLTQESTQLTNDAIVSAARRDLSGIIGTATESLNRTLSEFKDEGLIEVLEDGIKIKDTARLEKLVR